MKITKIRIQNYKSIRDIKFEVKKYGSSYTTMLVGINESGKSNILTAMSYLETPDRDDFNYFYEHNQKDEDNNPVDLWFSLKFENKNTVLNEISENIEDGVDLLKFEVVNIVKNVFLEKGETAYGESYEFDIKNLSKNLFIKKINKTVTNSAGQPVNVERFIISKTNDEEETFQSLTEEIFKEFFNDLIEGVIEKFEPKIAYWSASKEYLIEEEDLNEFSEDINDKKALRNIFLLAGYNTEEKIKDIIENISDGYQRSRLKDELQDSLNDYIQKIWNHDIDVVIDITETGKFTLSIKDKGRKNKYDRLPISGRSEGARHFLSLILSLSIESRKEKRKGQLILIDEPEMHLHPSGVRELKEELLEIGRNNYLFIATHSPFLIDRKHRERNIIIEKNFSAYTVKKTISEGSVIDDEVLQRAFGISVYKDLLIPHSILVEGASDTLILKKAMNKLDIKNLGITNGHGSNIVAIASLFNHDDISVNVVVDDDKEGRKYKEKILKIGGVYSSNNVHTIRDVLGIIKNMGTIEDLLNVNYVKNQFIDFYKNEFKEEIPDDFNLEEDEPFIEQIKKFLQKNKKFEKEVLEKFKIKLSENFNSSKKGLKKDFPLLTEFVEKLRNLILKKNTDNKVHD